MSDPEPTPLPAGDYAIVEMLGHRTLVGRITEVERFGTKLMSIEPLYRGELLPAVLIGGGSIYAFTPCSAEAAAKRGPTDEWQLPTTVRAALPPQLLAAPVEDEGEGGPEPEFAPSFLNDEWRDEPSDGQVQF